ncbi:PolB DNA polymerase elongation subunit (family B) [uncultured Caudovirales phage]|uniref:DNA-directed DNA polymerase n=1 Tax=uncultured Caudovirales phage TaxID=2100421 RepID=A0A6J5L1L4_9CAUD|nr:PolB DNA polymerase elongation subunit (family B) [uncultured Caudovirales phage]CAB5208994.1 PolB DNA polymerase elongation subunit (family B) [uncultured Caudovirales phage]
MSYVDAWFDRDNDIIKVVERNKKGEREFRDIPVKHTFYYKDPRGKYQSIYGDPVNRVVCKNTKELRKEQAINSGKQLFEADINPIFVCLSENYLNQDAPKLNVAFFDIEVDFDPERGYAAPDDAFMPITAIAVYLQWMETMVCLAVPPKTLTMEEAKEQIKDFPNTMLYETEAEMLDVFLDLIKDADVLSGWNSEGFDIPYTVNRVIKSLSKEDTRRFCLFDQMPKRREYEKFGRQAVTYDFIGRVHLDSLELYRKYTYEERHTYRLDAIAEYELGKRKTQYEGTLDQLYNNDFRTFIEYNINDCKLLDDLDKKLKFMDIANTLAHECTVLLQTTMGAVAVTEQAIINEAHRRGFQVPNRPKMDEREDNSAAGAYVAYPKEGIHDWIGSLDINSLYPSAIRALNMGPETIIGQLRQTMTGEYISNQMAKGKSFAAAWEGIFGSLEYTAVMNQEIGTDITIDWENGDSDVVSAAEVYRLIFESNQPWMISANGTIFTWEKEGIIPGLLKRWYAERKEMQAKLKDAIAAGNKVEEEYWDKRQLVKKINLNSLYGAILNPGCRFFDKRIGQSTTLTGRQIAKHMAGKVNEIIAGTYDHVGKAIIYGDTDSCYFSAYKTLKKEIDAGHIPWTKESVVQLYDQIGDEVNSTFPQFMLDTFHCPKSRGEVIKAGREIVGSKSLFITKKRYAVLYYDKEGKRADIEGKPGKIKAMGLDLKRSDTPEFIQDFLSDILEKVLTGKEEAEVLKDISEFRALFKARPGWEKGSPKRANKITEYEAKEKKAGKANMPGHVRASINWNTLKRMFDDKYSMAVTDGAKVIVCKLKQNPMGFTSVAYPVDELRLPQWFKDLPFDHAEMEATIIDKKLENLIGVLNWNVRSTEEKNTFNSLFEF